MSETRRPAVERMHPPDVLWKFVVNPVVRALLRGPTHRLVDRQLMLLHYEGRRTGTRHSVPVGHHWIDGTLCVLTNSGWRVNFRGGHRVVVRFAGDLHTGTAMLEEDPDRVAEVYARLIDGIGWERAGRRLGLRINVDRAPTHDELVRAARTSGLSVLEFDIGVTPPPDTPS